MAAIKPELVAIDRMARKYAHLAMDAELRSRIGEEEYIYRMIRGAARKAREMTIVEMRGAEMSGPSPKCDCAQHGHLALFPKSSTNHLAACPRRKWLIARDR